MSKQPVPDNYSGGDLDTKTSKPVFGSIVDGIYYKNHFPRQLHLLNSPPLKRPKRSESWLMMWKTQFDVILPDKSSKKLTPKATESSSPQSKIL